MKIQGLATAALTVRHPGELPGIPVQKFNPETQPVIPQNCFGPRYK